MNAAKIVKNLFKVGLLGGIILSSLLFSHRHSHPPLPSSDTPLLFYSNQTSDDLKIVFQRAIQEAKKSIFLQIYGCTDIDLLTEIQKAHERGIAVEVLYDPSGSGPLQERFCFTHPLACQGLMHKKILIIDQEKTYLGSANFTPTSLRMHDNLVAGLYQKNLAEFLLTSIAPSFHFLIGGQQAELWHLPDMSNGCLERILQEIDQAKSSIRLALFTFTHPKIVKALIEARKRGVHIDLVIDYYSSEGASKKTLLLMQESGIFAKISRPGKLLHHKWALIDEKILFLGSANWTQAAFLKNEDCLLVLKDLTKPQQSYFNKIWKEIELNAEKKSFDLR